MKIYLQESKHYLLKQGEDKFLYILFKGEYYEFWWDRKWVLNIHVPVDDNRGGSSTFNKNIQKIIRKGICIQISKKELFCNRIDRPSNIIFKKIVDSL